MTVLFGLLGAILYGLADFAGGLASRVRGAFAVLVLGYPVGAVLMTLLLPFDAGHPTARVFLFGAVGGLCGLLGVSVMYRLMTVAPLNVISPVTAVLASVVPVVVGVVIGERPHALAWIGIVIGLGAIVLVSRAEPHGEHGAVTPRVLALAVVSGLGFGLYFVFLARAGAGSGLWPLVVSRWASVLAVVPVALVRRAAPRFRGRTLALVLLTGTFDALANLCFLIAARHGLLSVASVLTALYPAATVILAMTLLNERATAVQRVGLGLAAGAIVLITV